ncbi:hypothetical protein ACLMJK_002295 [Lecanora helva]
MVNNITVAWATPVDAYDLRGQLESYVQSKGAISTFEFCIKHARSNTSIAKVPREVVEMVAQHLRQLHFVQLSKTWDDLRSCCALTCRPSLHFDEDELAELKEDMIDHYDSCDNCDHDSTPEEFEDYLEEVADSFQEHEYRIETYLRDIGEGEHLCKSVTPFGRLRKIFTRDFGLSIHFTVFHDYLVTEEGSHRIHVLAYLKVPSPLSVVKLSPGPLKMAGLSSMVLNPAIINTPSSEQLSPFKRALKILQLTPKLNDVQLTTNLPDSISPPESDLLSWSHCPNGPIAKGHTYPAGETYTKQDLVELEKSEWPKLMVLMGFHAESEDGSY